MARSRSKPTVIARGEGVYTSIESIDPVLPVGLPLFNSSQKNLICDCQRANVRLLHSVCQLKIKLSFLLVLSSCVCFCIIRFLGDFLHFNWQIASEKFVRILFSVKFKTTPTPQKNKNKKKPKRKYICYSKTTSVAVCQKYSK